jgi:hypothetical protein
LISPLSTKSLTAFGTVVFGTVVGTVDVVGDIVISAEVATVVVASSGVEVSLLPQPENIITDVAVIRDAKMIDNTVFFIIMPPKH